MLEENKIEENKPDTVVQPTPDPKVTSPEVTGQPPAETVTPTQPPQETPVETISLEQLLKEGFQDEGGIKPLDVTASRWEGKTKEDVIESYNQYRAFNDSEVAKLRNDLTEIRQQLGRPTEPVTSQLEPKAEKPKTLTAAKLDELLRTDPDADIGAYFSELAKIQAQEIIKKELEPERARRQIEEAELVDDYLQTFQEEGLGLSKPVFEKIINEFKNATTVDRQMKLVRDVYMGKTINQHLQKINQNRKTLSDTKRTEANQAFVGGMGASGEKVISTTGGGEKLSPAKQGARQFYKEQHYSS